MLTYLYFVGSVPKYLLYCSTYSFSKVSVTYYIGKTTP
uniref:Uncharacterized protein n=1 Tax=Arundo donax TaxID=35708 RepID=A0A0A9FKI8_ARUDO